MINRRKLLGTATAGAVLTVAAPYVGRPVLAADVIRIGALCELSGPASTLGTQQELGIRMAVDEINKVGGIDGRLVELIVEDTESKVAAGLAKAKKLVERDGVQALTGIVFSSISLGVQEYVNKEAKIPFLNTGSSSTAISEPPACGRYSFQAQPSARYYVMPALNAARLHGKRWAFIADDFPWGRLSVKLMKQAIGLEFDVEVLAEEYAPVGTTNYAPYIANIAAVQPDVVGMVVFGAGYARVLKQLQQMGVSAHKHHYFWSQVDAVAAGDAAIGMTAAETYTYENPSVPRAKEFADAFKAIHNSWPDPVAARAYTGVELLARAIKDAGGTDASKVVDALIGLTHDSSVIGPIKIRDCDHVAEAPVFMIEGKQSDIYGIYPKYAGNVDKLDALAIPCGQTGCENLTKAG